jgi:hypothetical protein
MLLGYGDLSCHIAVAAQGESPADQRLFQRVVQSKRLTDES